ncbi:hypothetical protein EGR_08059 [Echinococcus granulosus]|uniref:Uncharacterized protein n=1 Tax=Echinococcus granulosus TaxID=6210 RepID=W6U9C6_ECHGR|nr:hypothetical protein EGR_08059 [Echinococcus granulosus]EUB57111.1 hypothetical protein EGR_08059 [Echinococcus granulosus]
MSIARHHRQIGENLSTLEFVEWSSGTKSHLFLSVLQPKLLHTNEDIIGGFHFVKHRQICINLKTSLLCKKTSKNNLLKLFMKQILVIFLGDECK